MFLMKLSGPPLSNNDVQTVLSVVSDFPDVCKIMAGPNDPMDPVLQKEMDFVQDLLLKSASAEVSSTKAQKTATTKKHTSRTVLELVSEVAHDDVHFHGVEQL
jgi:hypothetical protein